MPMCTRSQAGCMELQCPFLMHNLLESSKTSHLVYSHDSLHLIPQLAKRRSGTKRCRTPPPVFSRIAVGELICMTLTQICLVSQAFQSSFTCPMWPCFCKAKRVHNRLIQDSKRAKQASGPRNLQPLMRQRAPEVLLPIRVDGLGRSVCS